jgi:hypothetical protein
MAVLAVPASLLPSFEHAAVCKQPRACAACCLTGGLAACLAALDLRGNQISVLPRELGLCSKLSMLELKDNPLVLPPPAVAARECVHACKTAMVCVYVYVSVCVRSARGRVLKGLKVP